jgi:hypothetical protein
MEHKTLAAMLQHNPIKTISDLDNSCQKVWDITLTLDGKKMHGVRTLSEQEVTRKLTSWYLEQTRNGHDVDCCFKEVHHV